MAVRPVHYPRRKGSTRDDRAVRTAHSGPRYLAARVVVRIMSPATMRSPPTMSTGMPTVLSKYSKHWLSVAM